jgi:hypothetical protein
MPKFNLVGAMPDQAKAMNKPKKKVAQSTLDALAKGRAKMMEKRKKKK